MSRIVIIGLVFLAYLYGWARHSLGKYYFWIVTPCAIIAIIIILKIIKYLRGE